MAIFVIFPLNLHAQLRSQHENTKHHQHKQKQDEAKHRTQQKKKNFTGLEWPRGFQEVKVPRLHDNGTGWW
jgi:hypothetical protein